MTALQARLLSARQVGEELQMKAMSVKGMYFEGIVKPFESKTFKASSRPAVKGISGRCISGRSLIRTEAVPRWKIKDLLMKKIESKQTNTTIQL